MFNARVAKNVVVVSSVSTGIALYMMWRQAPKRASFDRYVAQRSRYEGDFRAMASISDCTFEQHLFSSTAVLRGPTRGATGDFSSGSSSVVPPSGNADAEARWERRFTGILTSMWWENHGAQNNPQR